MPNGAHGGQRLGRSFETTTPTPQHTISAHSSRDTLLRIPTLLTLGRNALEYFARELHKATNIKIWKKVNSKARNSGAFWEYRKTAQGRRDTKGTIDYRNTDIGSKGKWKQFYKDLPTRVSQIIKEFYLYRNIQEYMVTFFFFHIEPTLNFPTIYNIYRQETQYCGNITRGNNTSLARISVTCLPVAGWATFGTPFSQYVKVKVQIEPQRLAREG